MKYYGGCDVGSTYTKAVILDEQGRQRGKDLIWIEHDLMDPRTVSRRTMRDKVNSYMTTVMRA
ncbi:MAG: 2-hydroxyacyl-CoA dehydratase, partial [Clostridia bacterium]|nr:2-hydroxyacyl-CoA dehydratase [Clostridia bacterium]